MTMSGPERSKVLRVLELYSGIGGMHCALRKCFPESFPSFPNLPYASFDVVAAIDVNEVAGAVYRLNFPQASHRQKSIEAYGELDLEKWNVDLVTMSPPCQPFTRQGLQKDEADARTNSLFHFLDCWERMNPDRRPRYILVENVWGFEKSTTRDRLIGTLNKVGFHCREFLLSPPQFGVPNSRLRYFLIGKLDSEPFGFPSTGSILRELPDVATPFSHFESVSPLHEEPYSKKMKISVDVVEPISAFLESVSNDDYLLPDVALKRYRVLDVTFPSSDRSCCFTKSYGRYAEGTGSVLQTSSDGATRDSVAKDIEMAHGVEEGTPLKPGELTEEDLVKLRALKLRYFTPKEISRLHCLPESFDFPSSVTRKQRWKVLGNSLNAHVVYVLLRLLLMKGDST